MKRGGLSGDGAIPLEEDWTEAKLEGSRLRRRLAGDELIPNVFLSILSPFPPLEVDAMGGYKYNQSRCLNTV